MSQKYLIVLAGPTATGKTDLSIDLAKHYNCSIISCDSRQLYKEMSIGTAVPSADIQSKVPHHFIQNISIHTNYSVGKFEKEALMKIEDLHKTTDYVLMVGGSGLYIDAVCKGFDDFPDVPDAIRNELNLRLQKEGIDALEKQLKDLDPNYHKLVDKANPHRIIRALEISLSSGRPYSEFRTQQQKKRNFKTIIIVLEKDRKDLYERINSRVDNMMRIGLLDEVKSLKEYQHLNALQTVGYRELFGYLNGDYSLEFAVSEIKKNTRRYAKRQMTWFRRYKEAVFFDPQKQEEVIKYINNRIKV